MSIYNTSLKYTPDWEPPDEDELDAIAVNDTFLKRVVQYHTGLKTVTMEGLYREESGDQYTVKVQRFKIVGSGINRKPGIEPDQLARVMTYAAQDHCNKTKVGEVVYRCYFYGASDEFGGNFQKSASFRLQPEDDGDDDSDSEGDEDKQSEDNEDKEAPRRPRSAIGGDRPTRVFTPAVESELVAILRIGTQQNKELQSDTRAAFKQFREDMSDALSSIGTAWSQVVDKAHDTVDKLTGEVENARKEASLANNRLVKMSEEHARQQQGEKNIMQYAMDMFTKAMQTQWSALGRDMAWERQIMYQQFDALAEQTKKDNRRGWVKDFAPIFLAVGGQIIEKMGNAAQGQMLQQLATQQLEDDDEEEEEEEEEEAKPEPPRRPRVQDPPEPKESSVMGVPAGKAPEDFYAEHPLASQFQLLGSLIKEDKTQLTKLKKTMGSSIFRSLEQAMSAKDDAEARTQGTKVLTSVLTKTGLQDKIDALLNEEQRELLGDISKQLFGGADTKKGA